MNYLLARKRSASSLAYNQEDFVPPSTQNSYEGKAPNIYISCSDYETTLATKGSFMKDSNLGITNESREECQTLLCAEQGVPKDSLFCDTAGSLRAGTMLELSETSRR